MSSGMLWSKTCLGGSADVMFLTPVHEAVVDEGSIELVE
jgi:hypothetical protein